MREHTQIKLCGFTRPEDVEVAIESGAAYVGLIFAPTSPRCISIASAQKITDAFASKITLVGVFQNQSLEEMQSIIDTLGLTHVQLHGDETPADAAKLSASIIRAVSISDTLLDDEVSSWLLLGEQLAAFLLDAPKDRERPDVISYKGYLQNVSTARPCFVAGQLTLDTLPQILETLRPWGIDVASGIESFPGIKDADKIRAFCRAVQEFDNAGVS